MVVLTGLSAAMLAVLSALRPDSPWIERIIRLWSGAGIRMAGVRLEVKGVEHLVPRQAYVFVANHISVLDIFTHFYVLPVPVRFLAKKELFRIPVLGQGLRAIGIVEVDRKGGPAALERVNAQARKAIARGQSLIVYAEGTRSRDGELQRFKNGAFVIAAATGAQVVPTTIYGTRQVMKADSLWVKGGKVTLVIDEPISSAGLDRSGIVRLGRQTREIIASRYDELRGLEARAQS